MSDDPADDGAPNPAALDSRISGQHPELEVVVHRDLAVRLPREGKHHCRDRRAGDFGHPCVGMLRAVVHVLKNTHVRVVGGEMPGVKVRLPRDSPDPRNSPPVLPV